MNLISKELFLEKIESDSSLKRGIDYFLTHKASGLGFSRNNSKENIYCNYNNYNCNIQIENKKIISYSCGCEVYKVYNKFCMHLISSIYEHNYQLLLKNSNLLKNISDYNLGFMIDIFVNKVMVTPLFLLYNKNHYIDNFNLLNDGILKIKLNEISTTDIPIKNCNDHFQNLINDLLVNDNQFIKKFTNKAYSLKEHQFENFLDYCFANNIVIFNEKDKTRILDYRAYLLDNDNSFTKREIVDNFFNKKILFKKNYNDLFFAKNDYYVSDFLFDNNKSYFLISSKTTDKTIVHLIADSDYENAKNFYWFINHGVSKMDFLFLYNYINEKFKVFNWQFDLQFIDKNNLLNQDALMGLEIVYNEQIKNPVLNVKYIYFSNHYKHLIDNEIDVENRKFDLEEKLFSKIAKTLNNYDYSVNGFTFNDNEDFLKVLKWLTINKNNKNFVIKIDKDLVFKQKPKSKFNITGLSKEVDLLKLDWKIDNYTYDEMITIVDAYIKKHEFVTLNDRVINILKEIDFDDLENQLKTFNLTLEDFVSKKTYVKKWNYFLLKNEFNNNETINEFLNQINNISKVELNCNPNLKQLLKPYQIYGCQWLKTHHKLQTGSILADDMGLGKTIQTITFIDDFYSDNQKHISLIVAPSSLIYNWKKEFEKFSPHLKVVIIDGNYEKRMIYLKCIQKYDVIVVSYNLLKIDLEHFKKINFDLVIIDEGHTIKNHSTKFSKSIKTINSKHRIALTGTPMENNALEMWSIFDFVMPGFLNDFNSFKKLINYSENNNFYSVLKNKISPFILRRTKTEVLKELPSKIEKVIPINFNEEQQKLYNSLLESVKQEIDESMKEKDIEKNKIYILSLLTKLRQLCCSPKLLFENATSNGAKFDTCMRLIDEIVERNEKVLIFSQFTSMIDILASELYKKNIPFHVITGKTNKKDRQNLVDSFNRRDEIKVFLISLKAGATGLNLTSASNVIHYDLWWNLSVENQASDRAHRIGQKKTVIVYKLIMNDSIEEKILDIQHMKKDLINSILNFDNVSYENLSMKDMLSILNIKKFDD